MFVNFSEEVKRILKNAEIESSNLNHPYVGSEHLFLSILKNDKLKHKFKKHGITYELFRQKLVSLVGTGSKKSEFILYTPLLKRVLENVVIEAREKRFEKITPNLLIIAILDEEDGIAYSILKTLNVNTTLLYYDFKNANYSKHIKKKLYIETIGTNFVTLAKNNKLDPVVGRNNELLKVVEILHRKKKNNPILVGPAGVGKTAIVEGLANLIASKKCPPYLKGKKVIGINIFQLVSGTKYRGEFEEKMNKVIKELEENKNIILFVDEIHTIVGAGGAEGAIDASNIFKPALARGSIKVIGATTNEEYKRYIEPDAALSRRFQIVKVEEPTFDSTVKILKELKPLYEKHHRVVIPNDLLIKLVTLSKKYLINRYEPDKSIDILDEACAKKHIKYINTNNYNEKLHKIRNKKMQFITKNNYKKACELKEEENKIINTINTSIPVLNEKDIISVIKEKDVTINQNKEIGFSI